MASIPGLDGIGAIGWNGCCGNGGGVLLVRYGCAGVRPGDKLSEPPVEGPPAGDPNGDLGNGEAGGDAPKELPSAGGSGEPLLGAGLYG